MLVGREEELYTHLRGAFSVARFDILGNAKALTRGTSDRAGSTFYICKLSTSHQELGNALRSQEAMVKHNNLRLMKKCILFLLCIMSSLSIWAESFQITNPGTLKETLMDADFSSQIYYHAPDGWDWSKNAYVNNGIVYKNGVATPLNRNITEANILPEAPVLHTYINPETKEETEYFTNEKVTVFDNFTNCKELQTINAPSIEKLNYNPSTEWHIGVFSKCKNLIKVNLPLIRELGKYAFSGCYKLESASLDNLEILDTCAFEYCSSLQDVYLPKVTKIKEMAFGGTWTGTSKKLKNIFIPNVVEIGYNAFGGCVELESIDLPKVEIIGSWAFEQCKSLKKINAQQVRKIYSGAFQETLIEKADFQKLDTLGGWAFKDCPILEKVSIPLVKYIDDGTFCGCTSLKQIYAPQVQAIGAYAFGGYQSLKYVCNSLESVDFPLVEKIGNQAFYGCISLKKANFPNAKSFGDFCFAQTALEELSKRNSMEYIGDYCFQNSNIKSFTWPNNVDSIKRCTFEGCEKLLEIKNLKNVKYIGERSFDGCSSLKEIAWPSNVDSILDYTFMNCKALEEIKLPRNVKHIGWGAFAGCGIRSFNFPELVDSIHPYTFNRCHNIEDFKIPNHIRYIAECTFEDCNIKYMKWPTSVDTIKGMTFNYSNINYMYIPHNVKHIARSAFQSAKVNILINNSNTSLGIIPKIQYYSSISPDGCSYNSEILYVPGGAKKKYTDAGHTNVMEIFSYKYSQSGNKAFVTVEPLLANVKIDSIRIGNINSTEMNGCRIVCADEENLYSDVIVYYTIDGFAMSTIYDKNFNISSSTGINYVQPQQGTNFIIDYAQHKILLSTSDKYSWSIVNANGYVMLKGISNTINYGALPKDIYFVIVNNGRYIFKKKIHL